MVCFKEPTRPANLGQALGWWPKIRASNALISIHSRSRRTGAFKDRGQFRLIINGYDWFTYVKRSSISLNYLKLRCLLQESPLIRDNKWRRSGTPTSASPLKNLVRFIINLTKRVADMKQLRVSLVDLTVQLGPPARPPLWARRRWHHASPGADDEQAAESVAPLAGQKWQRERRSHYRNTVGVFFFLSLKILFPKRRPRKRMTPRLPLKSCCGFQLCAAPRLVLSWSYDREQPACLIPQEKKKKKKRINDAARDCVQKRPRNTRSALSG